MTVRFSYINLTDSADLNPSSQTTELPASNIQDPIPTKVWRTTGTSSENLVLDLGAPKQATVVVLLEHNLTASATITLQANSSDSWSTPPFSANLDHHEKNIIKFFNQAQYRFWRLLLSDSGNPDNYLQLGRLWIGGHFQPDRDFHKNFTIETSDPTAIIYSDSGSKFATLRTPFRRLKISFPNTKQKTEFDQLLTTVNRSNNFIIALDPENTVWQDGLHNYTLYAHLDSDPQWSHRVNDRWALNLNIRETI